MNQNFDQVLVLRAQMKLMLYPSFNFYLFAGSLSIVFNKSLSAAIPFHS